MLSIDKINIIVASKRGIETDTVKKINSVYWKKIKSRLSNLEDTTVSIKGLVNFTISRYLIREKIYNIIDAIRYTKLSKNFTEKKKVFIIEEYYSYLRKLLKQRNEVAKLYYERNRKLYKINTESTGECSEDNIGDNQQSTDELQPLTGRPEGGDNQEEIDMCSL